MLVADPIEALRADISDARDRVVNHPVYACINSMPALRVFLEHHVYAVWDFMSLLKGLQRHLTCVTLPWRPVGSAETRRLVNSIVLEEESDEIDGEAIGHFEFYLRAMEEVGADTNPIRRLCAETMDGNDPLPTLARLKAPAPARAFVATTFDLLATGKPHVIAASFTFGREDSIASMFANLTKTVYEDVRPSLFIQYLERHIALDGDDHGPKALRMLSGLCGDDPTRWREASDAARTSLLARASLWDGVLAAMPPVSRERSVLRDVRIAAPPEAVA